LLALLLSLTYSRMDDIDLLAQTLTAAKRTIWIFLD
jgi:hypothetical protein